jgi:hypothetical protein
MGRLGYCCKMPLDESRPASVWVLPTSQQKWAGHAQRGKNLRMYLIAPAISANPSNFRE